MTPVINPATYGWLDFRISIEDCEWRLATQSTGIRRLLDADDRGMPSTPRPTPGGAYEARVPSIDDRPRVTGSPPDGVRALGL